MSFNAQRCSPALNGVQLDTVRLDDVLRLAIVQGGFYSLVAQRQVPGSRSLRATCHRRPASLSARARLGAECAVLYRVRASCRPAPASVVTGTVIWAHERSNLVEVLLLHLPRRSSLLRGWPTVRPGAA